MTGDQSRFLNIGDRLTVDNNGPLAVFAIALITAIISGDSDSPSLIAAVFESPSGQSFRLEPTVTRLSTEARLTPSAISSELARMAPNIVTATITLKTNLMIRSNV